MSQLEHKARLKNSNLKRTTHNANIGAALIVFLMTIILTLSYMNGNIFMEYLAVSGFIISGIAILRTLENK